MKIAIGSDHAGFRYKEWPKVHLESARLARAHNDANMLALGERLVPEAALPAIVGTWLATAFEGGRHARRLALIDSVPT